MFGGTTGYEYSTDLHGLDLNTFTWHKFDVEGQKVPEGRLVQLSVMQRSQ
jgi:hypothetical protein